jgi:hypothetical protein
MFFIRQRMEWMSDQLHYTMIRVVRGATKTTFIRTVMPQTQAVCLIPSNAGFLVRVCGYRAVLLEEVPIRVFGQA